MDIGSIAGVASSLKSAGEIVKAMIGLRDAASFQTKLIELNGVILAAQGCALTAQQDQMAMLERVRELEKEVAGLKAWDAEKQKYELKSVYTGAFAYVLKEEAKGSAPPHWLCTNCYERGAKSILQAQGRDKDKSFEIYQCPGCRSQMRVFYNIKPGAEKVS